MNDTTLWIWLAFDFVAFATTMKTAATNRKDKHRGQD